jgi:putative MATE family efflux protein
MTSFAFQSLVGFVDMLFVAQLGTESVAGVGVGSQVHFVAFSLISVVTTGTVALVARAIGAGDEAEADGVLQSSLLLAVLVGGALLLVIPFTEALVGAFGVSPSVRSVGGSYLRILLWASIPMAIDFTISSAMRGAGDVRTPLLVGLGMNAVNVVGDYALIFGHLGAPALGADGSALASVLAISLGAAVYLALWLGNAMVIRRGRLLAGVRRNLCRRILRIGTPSALEHLAFNLGLFLFLRLVAEFGTEAVSAYMIGVRILAFSFIPGLGFATAASTLVGQHLGAEQPRQASQAGWRATGGAVAVMSSVGLLIVLSSRQIAGWFGATGDLTAELTVSFILILGTAQPLMAVEYAVAGALRGAGDTRFPLLALLVGLFVFRLGAAVVVLEGFDGTVVAVWSCLLADYAVKALMLSARFHRGHWKVLKV